MDQALVIVAVGTVTIGVMRAIPPIVWSFRCPSDSPNYKWPIMPPRGEG